MKLLLAFLFSLLLINTFAGDTGNSSNMSNTRDSAQIADQLIDKLSDKKIYFGHHSVGSNIMLGIKEILTDNQKKKLRVQESLDASHYKGPMFAHSRIGYNTDPMSKIIGFSNYMENLEQWNPNIAMFKFCFVDVRSDADVNKLFQQYQERMHILKEKYPDVQFVHFTVPLTVVQSGIRANIKKIIGKPLGGVAANIKRNQYNNLLRKTYSGKEAIFDLANIESTREDGSRVTFGDNNKQYYALAPEYGSDGAHLNELGRQMVAKKLLEFLALSD